MDDVCRDVKDRFIGARPAHRRHAARIVYANALILMTAGVHGAPHAPYSTHRPTARQRTNLRQH
ncbi:hypothetical protein KCP75_17910 [Salmonella enterica subsp. enterica]|nr:hypothetical protein KCP75_17910 [Salmonella enterica subsp. enterica]